MSKRDEYLDHLLLKLTPEDGLYNRDACENIFVCGSSGGGKTTTVGKNLAYGLNQQPQVSGVVLVAKGEETANWLSYAKACGWKDRIVLFNESSGHCFDPIVYEWTRPGRGAGDVENIVQIFTTLQSLGQQHLGSNNEKFWELAAEKLERHSIKALGFAGEPVSIDNINRLIESLPTRLEEIEEPIWQKSYCGQVFEAIRARKDTLTPDDWKDLGILTGFLLKQWPSWDPKPRSSVEATWSGMADRFLFNPFNRILSSGRCTFTPEQLMREGKILVVDWPVTQYAETGRFINVLLKLIWMRAWLRRDIRENPHPNFLWMDEFQYFVTPRWDNAFLQTCRSSRVAVVALTQNILNISEALNEHQIGSKTKSMLGNFGTKFFLQQNCHDSCFYAADQVGKVYRYLDNYNAGSGAEAQHGHTSVGASRQLVHILEPTEFSRLLKPDGINPCAEAICYQGGKAFKATVTPQNPRGSNYLRVLFSRDI